MLKNEFLNKVLNLSPKFLSKRDLSRNFLNQKHSLNFLNILIENYNKPNFNKIFLNISRLLKYKKKIELIHYYQILIFFGFFKIAYEIKQMIIKKHFYQNRMIFLNYYDLKLNCLLDLEKNFKSFKSLNKINNYYSIFQKSLSKNLIINLISLFKKKTFRNENSKIKNFLFKKKILILGKLEHPKKINFKLYDTVVFVGFSKIFKSKHIKKSIYYFSDGTPDKIISNFMKNTNQKKTILVVKDTIKKKNKLFKGQTLRTITSPDFNYFGTLNLGLLCLIDIISFNPKKILVKNFSLFLPIKNRVYFSNKDIAYQKKKFHGGHFLFGHDPFLHFQLYKIVKKLNKNKIKFDTTLQKIINLGIKKYFDNLEKFYFKSYQDRISKLKIL